MSVKPSTTKSRCKRSLTVGHLIASVFHTFEQVSLGRVAPLLLKGLCTHLQLMSFSFSKSLLSKLTRPRLGEARDRRCAAAFVGQLRASPPWCPAAEQGLRPAAGGLKL